MEKMTTANAQHYIWGTSCAGWHLVNRPELSIILEEIPPGLGEAPHVHSKAMQFFFVLQGEVLMYGTDETIGLKTGQGVRIDAGEVHWIRNAGTTAARFLVVSQPHSHGDRTNVPQSVIPESSGQL